MPSNQAPQVFYGTIPLILITLGVSFRKHLLLKDILARLGCLADRIHQDGAQRVRAQAALR
jgi:hypothetical protein